MFFQIHTELYPFIVSVSIQETDKQLLKQLKKYSIKINKNEFKKYLGLEDYEAICSSSPNKDLVLRFRKKPETAYELGTLSHEVLHASIQIMKWVGMELSDSSEEAYTYLQGYLTRKILEQLEK